MKLIILFVSIALAAAAAFFVIKVSQEKPKAPAEEKVRVVVEPQYIEKEVPTTMVMVARSDIPLGTLLTRENAEQYLDRQPWPSHLVLEGFIRFKKGGSVMDSLRGASAEGGKGARPITGLVTRATFRRGEPIIMSKLANPNDPSFLAATLPPGMRAVTLSVDAVSGVAGFLFPGDRVDVLITHTVQVVEGAGTPGTQVTEVLLTDVKVLAVDQRSEAKVEGKMSIPSNVTVEVSQENAQKIRLAEGNGRLSLALRSMMDRDLERLARPTGKADLSRITPPAYFPVLYNTNSEGELEVVQEGGVEVASDAATAGAMTNVVITRGTERENVGVERP